jgi:anaerobic selenocysteine-containing dehydrogenase
MQTAVATRKTFCRFCHVFCGLEVDVADGRVVEVRGDHDNPISEGYTCPKGRSEVDRINHPDRLRACHKRVDGRLQPIDTVRALDEIGARLKAIIAAHGPHAVAVYSGCGGHRTAAGGPWFVGKWLEALGSRGMYTSYTIDSPALSIATGWLFGAPLPFGSPDIEHSDVALYVGTNPTVSHLWTLAQSNPSTRLKNALQRGMKLVVIDPRKCDVARRAHVHLQVKPGEDATLLAAMIKVIIESGWYDRGYVAAYCSGFEALAAAVADFDLEYAAARSTVPVETIVEGARVFATAKSGAAQSGTGLHMAAHQNLCVSLVWILNAICGRYDRRGGMTRITGALSQPLPENMDPIPLPTFSGEVSRVRGIRGMSGLFGYNEMPTNTLTDEILTPGEGQVRALIVNGGNPALVFSNTERTVAALQELDLLVCLDLFESATARYADYVMAVKHPFERADIPHMMNIFFPQPFMQYTDKLVEPPVGTLEEWDFFWETGERLGIRPAIEGLPADRKPTAEEIMRALNPAARVSLEDLAQHPSGKLCGERTTEVGGVIPDMIGHADRRIAVGHPEILSELREVRAEPVPASGGYGPGETYDFRAITYRMPEVYCTTGHNLPRAQRKRPYNPVLISPADLAARGFADGECVFVESSLGRQEGILEASDEVAPGTLGIAHGWGDPADARPVEEKGTNVQALIPAHERYDRLTGLAQQSAYPVNLRRNAGRVIARCGGA